MLRKSPAIYICALLVLLSGLMLTSCMTCFFLAPYTVGQKRPDLDESALGGTSDKKARTIELYRIGEDYYLKLPFIYKPWNNDYELSSFMRAIAGFAPTGPSEDERTWERAYCYCRVSENTQSTKEWKAEKIPVLPKTPGQRAGAITLTEKQAAKLNPVFVKKLPTKKFHDCFSDIPSRFSWTHYAMLPVSAAVLVCIDIPCSIIGTICIGVPYAIMEEIRD